MLTRSVWNVTPLPGNRFRPQPLPKPERNAPCPCGSGRKFKRCCKELPLPTLDSDEIWVAALDHLDQTQIRQAAQAHAIPGPALAALAEQYLEEGRNGKAKALLEPLFDGDPRALGGRYEPALSALCDAYTAVGHVRKKQALLEDLSHRASKSLRAAAWQRLATVHMDDGNPKAAWHAFQQAQRTDPQHVSLAPLEITLLMAEDRIDEASSRARFWHNKLESREEASPELLAFLNEVAADPIGALKDPHDLERHAENSERLGRLGDCLDAVRERPLPDYAISAEALVEPKAETAARLYGESPERKPADEQPERIQLPLDRPDNGNDSDDASAFDERPLYIVQTPAAVTALEQRWHDICPLNKPFSTSATPFVDEDPWVPEIADTWLDLLRRDPTMFDSIDVLDDLATLVEMHEQAMLADVELRCYAPLLERGVAILDRALERSREGVELEWAVPENRPALRLLHNYAMWLSDVGERTAAHVRFWQYLRLNPSDNHGIRSLLVNEHLRVGEDRQALALCVRYPDDMLVETMFGAVLANYRLGDMEAARAALHQAHRMNPHVVGMLRRTRVREPEMSQYGVRVGGEDQAWLYREDMRDIWVAVEGLLDWTEHTLG